MGNYGVETKDTAVWLDSQGEDTAVTFNLFWDHVTFQHLVQMKRLSQEKQW